MIDTYTRDIGEIVMSVRDFARKELAPHASRWDEEERFPPGMFKRLGDLGVLGVTVPESQGGVGLGAVAAAAVMEELAAADPGVCLSYLAHSLLFAHNLAVNGSEAQVARYMPGCISGEAVGGMAMTEPEAGSDAVSMRTTATRKEGRFVLNGAKTFITNSPEGDVFLVYTRAEGMPGKLSLFLVERGTPGFSSGRKLKKMGMRASPTGELVMQDCEVPEENLVGGEGDAVRRMMRNLEIERVGLAAMSLGIHRAAMDLASHYAAERRQFGKPVLRFQAVSHKLADMYIAYRASRHMVYDAARAVDSGARANLESASAKVFASEAATKAAMDAIQILGGYGYTREFAAERLARDAKLLEIGGGTSEILRNVVVKDLVQGFAPL